MTGYAWSISAGGSITAGTGTNSITVTWNTAAAQTVSVNYTNSNSCTAASPTVYNVTVNALPAITGTLDVCLGSNTQLTGSGTPAVTNPWVSATPGVAAVSPAGLVTSVSAGTSVITYTNNNGCNISATVTVTICYKTLNLTSVMLEGLYNGAGTMKRAYDEFGQHWLDGSSDHITVELHSATTYATIVFAANDVPLSTIGSASITTVPYNLNGSYYITIRNRTSIETTTAAPVSFGGSIINYAYDSPSKVYGNNLILMTGPGSHYAIFGGDVNQNGLVESFDMTPIDNLSSAFGYDFNVDVNSDGLIDSRDMTIVDNNNAAFVSSILP